ncbi:hypothetical protein Ahia01_000034400, partial [Argonauta hians]
AKSKLEQWAYSKQTIRWFYNLNVSSRSKFLQVDISNYYTSISKDLLIASLNFAQQNSDLTKDETLIILHARKTLVSFGGKLWTKKGEGGPFYITMGAQDSAQVTDLVGLYILRRISRELPYLLGGGYRDDFLFLVNTTNRNYEKTKKLLHKLFNSMALSIEIQAEYRRINYLDTTLDLDNHLSRPYHKPNETINYIHKTSNHPTHIKTALATSISARISTLSHNHEVFKQHAQRYNDALRKAGYSDRIEYIPSYSANPAEARNKEQRINPHPNTTDNNDTNKRVRSINRNNNPRGKRYTKPSTQYKGKNVLWFNPVYNCNVKTKIGREFFAALANTIPKGHKLYKLLNRNTVKLSYATTPNIKSYIDKFNLTKIRRHLEGNAGSDTIDDAWSGTRNPRSNNCNCRNRAKCPDDRYCRRSNLVYACRI